MTECHRISHSGKRELPSSDLSHDDKTVPVSLLSHADGVAIAEIACKSVNLISIGLTGEAKGAHNCQSKKSLDAHAVLSDKIEVADALVADDATDGLSEGVGHRELFHLSTVLRIRDRVGEDNLLEG